MKEMIRYGFILAVICVVASALLAGVNALTGPRIIAQAQAEEEASIKEVMPLAEHFEAVKSGNDTLYYKAHDKNGKLIGVVFKATGKGYSSTVETVVGMKKDGQITAIKVISQNETPGLGAQVAGDGFSGQFKGQDALKLSGVEAITGATISSRAVIDSVKNKSAELWEVIKNEK